MKLYAVISTNRATKREKLHVNLAPMNHPAACNFIDACRNDSTTWRLGEWPEDVPQIKPPMMAERYRNEP